MVLTETKRAGDDRQGVTPLCVIVRVVGLAGSHLGVAVRIHSVLDAVR